MNKINKIQKTVSKILSVTLATVLATGVVVSANSGGGQPSAEIKTKYQISKDLPIGTQTSATNPCNGWLCQYNTGEEMSSYANMEWKPQSKTSTWYEFGRFNDAGNATNYISGTTFHPQNDATTAAVWVAPSSGRIHMESGVNIKKANALGYDIDASIIKTSADIKTQETLWSETIKGTDNVGEAKNNYSIDIDVKAGERIYFQIACEKHAHAGTTWDPIVEYLQTSVFTVDETSVKNISEVKDGDSVKCMLYDKEDIEDPANAYLAVYDKTGALRRVVGPYDFEMSSSDRYYNSKEVVMNFGEETYDGWKISLFILTTDTDRTYSTGLSRTLNLD